MHIVQVDQLPMTGSTRVRAGTGHSSRHIFNSKVLNRDPERPDNFTLHISYVGKGEFSSPRHRHNFDQYRYVIEGEADYPEGKMTPGVLGYFPEGASYGPQENIHGTIVIAQFGGPSGQGYLDRDQMKRGLEELKVKNTGAFEDGIYYRNPGVDGEAQQDAHEAVWEYVRKQPLRPPAPQYATPILIDSNAYPWMPIDGAPGLAEKALGTFTSCKFGSARYKLEPGAGLTATGRGAFLVLSGEGRLDEEPYRKLTALYLEDGESAVFTADEVSDILMLGLPSMARMAHPDPQAAA